MNISKLGAQGGIPVRKSVKGSGLIGVNLSDCWINSRNLERVKDMQQPR